MLRGIWGQTELWSKYLVFFHQHIIRFSNRQVVFQGLPSDPNSSFTATPIFSSKGLIPETPYLSFFLGPGFWGLSFRPKRSSIVAIKESTPKGLPVRSYFLNNTMLKINQTLSLSIIK